ncbi:substrate-binding periplasmic protein [Desulfogranum mediterraneum]|uniref:substrate-binding periplasmic protein n=1 Tax=Desulfogranum mediterraneum TaxID=160661 RepID=UPI000410E916|nr:transporter substrate-binding domain-containing protein [Desulfogranum mediterraneum]
MRYSTLLPALFSCLLAALPAAQARSTLVVSGNPEAPPISWNRQGTLSGIGPTLAAAILNELKIDYTLQSREEWAGVLEELTAGKLDMVVSAYKNKQRLQELDFSEPFLKSPVVMVVKKGDSFRCNCWDDMRGKKGVAAKGESFGDRLDRFIADQLDLTFTSYQRAFEMLAEDTADYLLIDLYPAIIYAKLLMVEDKIEFLEKPVTVQPLHMAFSKKSVHRELLPLINRQLQRLKEAGAIEKLAMEQYKAWNKNFQQRQDFYARSHQEARQAQEHFNAGARDRGLENLARFYEREVVYMDGSGEQF